MPTQPWLPLAATLLLALGLAGCGDDAPSPPEADQATQESAAPVDGEESDRSSAADSPSGDLAPSEDTGAGEASTVSEEAASEATVDMEADAETLGESPAETLEEGEALPGETTREDVDAIIEETERRFEEASRRIDEQFEQAELREPVPTPMDTPEGAPDLDAILDPAPAPEAEEDGGRTEADAVIEETEKRFEEARRAIDEQFEQAERETSGREGETTEPGSVTP